MFGGTSYQEITHGEFINILKELDKLKKIVSINKPHFQRHHTIQLHKIKQPETDTLLSAASHNTKITEEDWIACFNSSGNSESLMQKSVCIRLEFSCSHSFQGISNCWEVLESIEMFISNLHDFAILTTSIDQSM